MRISDWSSDVCSSDLVVDGHLRWADDAILVNPDPDEHRVLHDLPGFEDQVHPARERAGLAHVARLQRLADAALENLRKLKAEARRTAPATASTSPAFSVWRVPPTIRNRNNTMSALTKPVKEADSTRPSARTAPVTYTEISESWPLARR